MNKDTARDYLPLVKAMAEGRVIQVFAGSNGWVDAKEIIVDCCKPSDYRIKPELKEYWFNRYEHDVMHGPYSTKKMAIEHSLNFAEQVLFREVIE